MLECADGNLTKRDIERYKADKHAADCVRRVPELENSILELVELLFFENEYHGDETEDQFWGDIEFEHGKHIALQVQSMANLVLANRPERDIIELLNNKATNSGPQPTGEKS